MILYKNSAPAALKCSNNSSKMVMRYSICEAVRSWGTHQHATRLTCRCLFKITCALDLLISRIFPNYLTVSRRSSRIITLAVFTIVSEIAVLCCSSCGSSMLSLPFKNADCHRKHIAHDTQSSLKASRSIANMSASDFSREHKTESHTIA